MTHVITSQFSVGCNYSSMLAWPPTEQHNVVTPLQNVTSLHAVQLCYSVGSFVCNVVNGTRKAVYGNVMQCCGSCPTLPNVMECCHAVAKRYPTLCNVVTSCALLYQSCATFQVVQRCHCPTLCNVVTTMPNVIQRYATLQQRCQALYNAVQRCYNVAKRNTKLRDVVTTLPNVTQRCTTLLHVAKRYATRCNIVTKLWNVPKCATLIHFIQRCTTL